MFERQEYLEIKQISKLSYGFLPHRVMNNHSSSLYLRSWLCQTCVVLVSWIFLAINIFQVMIIILFFTCNFKSFERDITQRGLFLIFRDITFHLLLSVLLNLWNFGSLSQMKNCFWWDLCIHDFSVYEYLTSWKYMMSWLDILWCDWKSCVMC